MTEDSIRAGQNWYMYCDGNPVMFIDPLGLEKLVVSGEAYGYEGKGYKYNFIEPAIKDLYRLVNENETGETITWLIADEGWSYKDKQNFIQVAKNDLNINLRFFSSTDNLIDYLNEQDGNRKSDPITKFIVYSHGFEEYVSFGYNYTNSYNMDLNFYKEDISRLNPEAFKNPDSRFESCNTGTGGDNSFAAIWKKQVGGRVWAYEGKSSYYNIMYPKDYNRLEARFCPNSRSGHIRSYTEYLRKDYGFFRYGSMFYPEPGNNAYRREF